MASGAQLIEAIAATLRQASTQALDLSFNELLDMHESGEMNINPDYQRLFRWSEGQRSRFIESLLLEMPVPPIFVIEEGDGTYQLIDGLQRISSYLHLRGKLIAPHLDPPVVAGEMLVLSDCDIVPALNGLTYNDFPTALQIRLKRAFIRVEVVRKETDPRFKYHMFKRLNTGGELLSSQQLRNCTIRLLDSVFPDFVIRMSEIEEFKGCTRALTQERRLSAFDQELVLRFFALKNRRAKFKHEVSDFLTEYMEDVADRERPEQFDYAAEEANFRKTFGALHQTLGEYAFAFANRARNDLSAGFSIYHFEAMTIGMQVIIDRIDVADAQVMEQLRAVLREIKLDARFISITTGGGKNSPGPLNERIGFVERRLIDAFPQ
ncbi:MULTISPECIES: DUF262 domain-containing protein [unclassified Bradyrhizobium]|uniref:DUF262 domain-containing protein n=1 Tax=unclassified Bradyrhizobium TaxID=2631580 RepID=UPI002915EE12|nr:MULTISPECIES: DUF262 domain-containing protein [unclassified Bradyrhizobium]